MISTRMQRLLSLVAILAMFSGPAFASGALAQEAATPVASPVTEPESSTSGAVDLDVLFIGAHPDDEAGGLSTYGQWNEYNDVKVGVITITRGEGGGNAVGKEEGPALGLIREAEERSAVGKAGIEHIYNLDKVDFYYTVSAPLTQETWGYDDTLERVVRVIRQTTPDVIVTMNPAPTPGNHGNHQMAGRFAVAGYVAAADPTMFPDQITKEGLQPWTVRKIFRSGAAGEGQMGESCASTYQPAEPTDVIDGVWAGRVSDANDGLLWSQVERSAQQMYASQGWAAFPDAATDPAETGCDFFTLIDSRVPFTLDNTDPTAMLEGAVVPGANGLPLGTQFSLETNTFDVAAGGDVQVTAHVSGTDDSSPQVELVVPDGWTVEDPAPPFTDDGNGGYTSTIGVHVASDAASNTRFRLTGTLITDDGRGSAVTVVQVVPPVRGELAPLPQVAQFQEWTQEVGVPQLNNLIKPVASLGSGQSRQITVNLTNSTDSTQTGTVSLDLPDGFTTDAMTKPYPEIFAGENGVVTFTVTNSDTALPTSNQGGDNGDYDFTITTETGGVTSVETAALEIVPVTTVEEVAASPDLDGVIADGEYPGEALDLSRIWEGDDLDSPADGGGTAHIAWGDDGIYVAVQVTDDTLGAEVSQDDAKRHWRTDSVEIAIDPLGTAENTSSTFKVGIFPTTSDDGPAASRDADAWQGPVSETAPRFRVASQVSDPYIGYVIETFIPFADLPADIDPDHATMNIFIYDSDTQDLTGQTRLGWSTWGGVQGDPYRWGKTIFEGYTPPTDARTVPAAPKMPLDAAHSADSPQSILQSAQDGVGLAGQASVAASDGISVDGTPTIDGDTVTLDLTSGSDGTVTLFDWQGGTFDANQATTLDVTAGESATATVPRVGDGMSGQILISFVTDDGQVQALVVPYGE